jgi:hypothetical protein
MARTKLTPKTRFEVFKRDHFRCFYCGRTPPDVVLHVDHVIAVANGGTNSKDNLVSACIDCNIGKGARPLTAVPDALSSHISRMQEAREQLQAYSELMREMQQQADDAAWEVLHTLGLDELEREGTIRQDWHNGTKVLLRHTSKEQLMEFAVWVNTNLWRKRDRAKFLCFARVAWNHIKGVTPLLEPR